MPLFDTDFLSKLEYLSIVSKRVFSGKLIAQRRTRQMGSGIEFADHQEYAPGDDFRYLDWNVYARHGELLLKRFHEEEDLHVYVLLDVSQSMDIGEANKLDQARRVAAALAYIALADLDRVAITTFADRLIDDLPMTRGKGRILSLLRFLENVEPAGEHTNLGNVAEAFIRRRQRPGPALVISDFYDPHGFEKGIDILRYNRFEPHVIQIFDPAEQNPQMLGDMELLDVETAGSRQVTVTESTLRKYRQLYKEFVEKLESYTSAYGLSLTRASSEVPFDELILRMMRATEVVA